MGQTSIEWTDRSVNPIRARLRDAAHVGVTKGGYDSGVGHYCEKISSGCAHCYASTSQRRFGMPPFPGVKAAGVEGVELFFDDSRLHEVLSRRAPTKWFWCDMTDMFGRWVPDEWIDKCFAAMALTPQHMHQVLTKRPERMAEYLAGERYVALDAATREIGLNGKPAPIQGDLPAGGWPLPNVWLGTSVEDQKNADERIPHLLRCPAAVRFLSCEPLLGPISFRWLAAWPENAPTTAMNPGRATDEYDGMRRLDWVIVGGESGPGARPCDVAWVRGIRDQCKASGVACFIKQMGSKPVWHYDEDWVEGPLSGPYVLKDKKGGNPDEWEPELRVREFPAAAAVA